MATCSWSRLLVVAAGLGLMVSWITGSDALGWIAAGVGAAGSFAVDRWVLHERAGACAVPERPRERA